MPKTKRNKGRIGIHKSKQVSRFNKPKSKFNKRIKTAHKTMDRNANKEAKKLKNQFGIHLIVEIHELQIIMLINN